MMEPIGLQVKPPSLDPFGAMRQGSELAQMGLNLQQTQAQLRKMAIDEQQASLTLDQKRREDAARRAIADIMRRHTKADVTGKNTTDLRAALAEARLAGLDPNYLGEIEQKLFANEASALKTDTERMDYVKKTLDEAATDLRAFRDVNGNPDEAGAARFLESKMQKLHQATGIPMERLAEITAGHFNLRQGGSLVRNADAIKEAQTINPMQEATLALQGAGKQARTPGTPSSDAIRAFAEKVGLTFPPSMSRTEIEASAEFKPYLELWKQSEESQILGAGPRAEQTIEAGRIGADRRVYEEARAAYASLRQLGTRLGSFTQSAWNNLVKQGGNEAKIQAAIDDYNERNKTNIQIWSDGYEAVMNRLQLQNDKMRDEQRSRARLGQTGRIAETAREKEPPVKMVTLRGPRDEPIQVPESEVEEARAAIERIRQRSKQ